MKPGNSVFLRKFVRRSKTDPLVEKVRLLHVNPSYAFIKYPDGRESSVSLRDLAPCPNDKYPSNPAEAPNSPSPTTLEDPVAEKQSHVPAQTPLQQAFDEQGAVPVEIPQTPVASEDSSIVPVSQTLEGPDLPCKSPGQPIVELRRSRREVKKPDWMKDFTT